MRRKPVQREEISFRAGAIMTMPASSMRQSEWGRPEPIARLWAPLLRSLNREQKQEWDARAGMREKAIAAGAVRARDFGPLESITMPQPYGWDTCTCQQCGKEFWRARHASQRYCSDTCTAAARRERHGPSNARIVEARSEARAAARAGLVCITCGKPLEAARSTRKTCSGRCRTIAYRRRGK